MKKSQLRQLIREEIKKSYSVNEGDSDPMSSLLQTFEKAMTDKVTYAKVAAELEGAADDVKPKLMQMVDEVIPKKRDEVLELISDLEKYQDTNNATSGSGSASGSASGSGSGSGSSKKSTTTTTTTTTTTNFSTNFKQHFLELKKLGSEKWRDGTGDFHVKLLTEKSW